MGHRATVRNQGVGKRSALRLGSQLVQLGRQVGKAGG